MDTLIKMMLFVGTAILCGAAARQGLRAWWIVASLLLIMAINVWLRLEIPVGRSMINLLTPTDLDEASRSYQARAALAVVVSIAVAAGAAIFVLQRWLTGPLVLAVIGLAMLIATMALRGASLHFIDRALGKALVLQVNARQLADGLALCLIALGAILAYRQSLMDQPLVDDEQPDAERP